jgi:hypothetical protein
MKRGVLLVISGAVTGLVLSSYVPPVSADVHVRELRRMEVDGDPNVPTGTIPGPALGQAPENDRANARERVRSLEQGSTPRSASESGSRFPWELRAAEWRFHLWNVARRALWILT